MPNILIQVFFVAITNCWITWTVTTSITLTSYPKADDIFTFRSKTENAAVVSFTDTCGDWDCRGGVLLGVVDDRGGLRGGQSSWSHYSGCSPQVEPGCGSTASTQNMARQAAAQSSRQETVHIESSLLRVQWSCWAQSSCCCLRPLGQFRWMKSDTEWVSKKNRIITK